MTGICEHCGNEFQGLVNRRYCSNPCYEAAYKKRVYLPKRLRVIDLQIRSLTDERDRLVRELGNG